MAYKKVGKAPPKPPKKTRVVVGSIKPLVRVKKDPKTGKMVRVPPPKVQGGPSKMYYPKTKKRKPATK